MNARARKKRQKVKVEGLLSLVPEEEGKRQGERERKERFFCLPFVGEGRSKSTSESALFSPIFPRSVNARARRRFS
jgi:hypothetical protein